MNKYMLSIVVPLYNSEKYIGETIDSVLNQKDIGFELIIVNDGSTDASRQICEERLKGKNNAYIVDQENSGAPKARNNGLNHATGNYVLFLDSDDVLCEGVFEQLEQICTEKYYECIIGNFVRIEDEDNISEDNQLIKKVDLCHLFMIPPYPCNKFYKRELLIEKGMEFANVRITQDLNFYFKFLGIVDTNRIKFIDINICKYRWVGNSISHSVDRRILDIMKSVNNCLDFFKENGVSEDNQKYMMVSALRHICYQIKKTRSFKNKDEGEEVKESLKQYWKVIRKKCKYMGNTYYLYRLFKADILYLYTAVLR